MKKLFLFLLLITHLSNAADNIFGSGGNNLLLDNSGRGWISTVSYTTDGNGNVQTLSGLGISGDEITGLGGNNYLTDNNGRTWQATVGYTTDGNGNVVPITAGGGGGGVSSVSAASPLHVTNPSTDPNITFNNFSAGQVLAGPTSGPSATPSPRSLVASDIPPLPYQSPLPSGTSSQYLRGDLTSQTLNTSVVPESGNLYFTTSRAQSSISSSSPLTYSSGVVGCQSASGSQAGCLSSADWTTFNNKQSALTFGNLTGIGFPVTGGTNAVIGSGAVISMTIYHDLYVTRLGTDASTCGSIAYPCHTVGYVLANLVTSPSSTSVYTIHISDRCDAEVDDLLIPPYVFLSGGGTDVAAYLRLPAGKAIKLGSGWTSNGRSGIQSLYLGGGTSVDLDFVSIGGSAGSNFAFDNVQVTGSFNHTGRGVNGGDFLFIQNSYIFGAATLTSDQLQSNTTTWDSTITATTSSTVNTDLTFLDSQVVGDFSLTETNAQECSMTSTGTTFLGAYAISGTVTLTQDLTLPSASSFSAGTTIVPTTFTYQSASANQPACTSSLRGLQWLIQSSTGIADIFQICQQTISGYAWVTH